MSSNAQRLRELLMQRTPITEALIEEANVIAVAHGVARDLGDPDLGAFVDHLERDPDVLERLVAAIAVPETWLVRYPKSFEFLIERLMELRNQSSTVKMISAACATGQEALTMVAAAVEAGFSLPDIRVDAVDISSQAIARARTGLFRSISVRGEMPMWARRALRFTEDGSASAREEFLDRVVFAQGDLFSWEPADAPYDMVFFRNLLIYLDPERGRELLARCVEWLDPAGCLFLGHADPAPVGLGLQRVRRGHTFAFEWMAQEESDPEPEHKPMHGGGTAFMASKPRSALGVPCREEIEELVHSGRSREALQAVMRLLDNEPMNASVQLLAGSLLLGAGHNEDARRAFERAVHLDSDEDEALIQLAMLAERDGAHEDAARYRRRAERAFRRRHGSSTEVDP